MQFKDQSKLKAITFSYDDGVTQDIRLIELLNKYGLKCTFNLNSELLGKNNILIRQNQRIAHYKVAPQEVKYVYEGHEIAAHTLTHPNLTKLTEAEIIHQVEQDRINLSELAGYEVVGMAYPCGGVNNDDCVADIIKNNTKIQYCRTNTITEILDIQNNLYRFNPNVYHINFDRLMQMGRDFVESTPEKPQILYIYGHAYEMDSASDLWIKLEEFFEMISGRDDVFYGTNAEVLL